MIARILQHVLFLFAMIIGSALLVLAAAAFMKSTQPDVLLASSNMIFATKRAYQELAVAFAIVGALVVAVAVSLYNRLKKRKPQPPASHF